MIGVDTLRTPAELDLSKRLLELDNHFALWLDRYQPDEVAIERVFSQANVTTAMTTAQVSAVLMVAASRRGIPVTQHTPTEVKASVTGNGRADKSQVGTMVARLLGLSAIPAPADSADAIALGICHIWRSPMRAVLAAK
jgi:crossover junction endodeoxyribonuclease RuvC